MPTDSCHDALHTLLAKDLSTWTGLPPTCSIASLDQLEIGQDESHGLLGEDGVTTDYRNARATSYAETMKLWVRDGVVVRISVPLPELPDPPKLLAALGAPDAKLDTWHSTVPVVNKEGEWVYARRGLALVLSTNKQNVMELIVFPATTADHYRKQLRYSEQPRELPE